MLEKWKYSNMKFLKFAFKNFAQRIMGNWEIFEIG